MPAGDRGVRRGRTGVPAARGVAGRVRTAGEGDRMKPVLAVNGLVKTFGSVTAVDGVSFALAPGDSLGIVGESGSGKTTTARILAGLETPTAGSVLVGGEPAKRQDRRVRARRLQMIFQDPYGSFDPRRTVAESIAEPLRLHAPRADRGKRVGELLDQVGLDRRAGAALPRDLSGGQRQRAAIARALGIEPRVLVLDE